MAAFLGLLCAMVFLGGLVSAAVWDVITRTIPNILVLMIAAAAAGLLLVATPRALPGNGAVALLVLAAGAALFFLRLWGAGDAKLLAAAALVCGARGLPLLILGTAVIGGVLALFWMAARFFVRRDTPGAVTVPYGAAIACGAILSSASVGALGPLSGR